MAGSLRVERVPKYGDSASVRSRKRRVNAEQVSRKDEAEADPGCNTGKADIDWGRLSQAGHPETVPG